MLSQSSCGFAGVQCPTSDRLGLFLFPNFIPGAPGALPGAPYHTPCQTPSGWATHLCFSYLIPFLHCLWHPWALKGCGILKEILTPLSPMVWPRVLSLTRSISFLVMKN